MCVSASSCGQTGARVEHALVGLDELRLLVGELQREELQLGRLHVLHRDALGRLVPAVKQVEAAAGFRLPPPRTPAPLEMSCIQTCTAW